MYVYILAIFANIVLLFTIPYNVYLIKFKNLSKRYMTGCYHSHINTNMNIS